jgi:hypothetical protein
MTSLVPPSPPACNPRLAAWLRTLVHDGLSPSRVLCVPCSTTNDTFSVVALYSAPTPPKWLKVPCLSALTNGELVVDVVEHVRALNRGFQRVYTEFGGVNVDDTRGGLTVTASVGDHISAVTATVHLLKDGTVLCFESEDYAPPADLLVLQRVAYSSAKTFDALLMPKSKLARDVLELRLVEKKRLREVSQWAQQSGCVVMQSPAEPIPPRLILQIYGDGCSAEDIVDLFLNPSGDEESDAPDDDDEEWCAEDSSSESSDDSADSDLDFDAEEELDNLR